MADIEAHDEAASGGHPQLFDWLIVGHQSTFDGEHAAVVIGDDGEERRWAVNAGEKMHRRTGVKMHHGMIPKVLAVRD